MLYIVKQFVGIITKFVCAEVGTCMRVQTVSFCFITLTDILNCRPIISFLFPVSHNIRTNELHILLFISLFCVKDGLHKLQ